MNLSPEFPSRINFSVWFADRPHFDLELLQRLDPLLQKHLLVRDEYLVKCYGSRERRWKECDRWLSWDELSADVKKNEADGFVCETFDGLRLPYLMHRWGAAWRSGGVLSTGMNWPRFKELYIDYFQVISGLSPVAFASLVDSRYCNWMSCNVQWLYQRDYGPAEGLPLKPDPEKSKEDLWIDSSLFPGRSERIPEGHISVASHMWLGPEFWKIAACTAEQIKAQEWLKWEEWPHGVLYIHCWPVPFNRPDGEQGILQKKLWRLLYDRDCLWPLPDGVGGPHAKVQSEEKPPEAPPPRICPFDPPQVATAVFDGATADLPEILLSTHRTVVDWGIHRGRYDVFPTESRKERWRNHMRNLTVDEATLEVDQFPQDGITMLLNTGDLQDVAVGICPAGVQPGKVLVRMIGPLGNDKWIPHYAHPWMAALANLPGFELGWMGNVDAELGLPTPPSPEMGSDHDYTYVLGAMSTPDRWQGQPIGSTMWFSKSEKGRLEKAPFKLNDGDGILRLAAWHGPFSACHPEPGEAAVREKQQTLLYG